MATTVQDKLNLCNPNDAIAYLSSFNLGDLLAGMVTRVVARTGLTSLAAQPHNSRCPILACNSTAGTPLAVVHTSAPDSGEVRIEYDSTGLPTLTFNAAVTAYTVSEGQRISAGHSAQLAVEV